MEEKRKTLARRPDKKDQVKEDLVDIGARIFNEVLWPKGKDMISGAVDMLLYKQVRGNNQSLKQPYNVIDFTNYTNYNAQYNQQPANRQGVPVRNNYCAGSGAWRFEDVLFDSPEEAMKVWYVLNDIVIREGKVNLLKYYETCNAAVEMIPNYEYYGWTHLGDSPRILKQMFTEDNGNVVDKYVMAMPKVRYIGGR